MNQNQFVSTVRSNIQPKNADQPQEKAAYKAPRLVVIGTAVELVQGYGGRAYIDGQGFNRDRRN